MRTTTKAPYAPGDKVKALVMTRDGVTCLAVITIDSVCRLADSGNPRWRVGGNRPGDPHPEPARDCPRVEWEVGSNGRDIHNYVQPATLPTTI
jgi:hypothetical protein